METRFRIPAAIAAAALLAVALPPMTVAGDATADGGAFGALGSGLGAAGTAAPWLGALAVLAIAVVAGATTTLAGMGGGILLTIALSLVFDPLFALTVTAPTLLVGNLHRLWLYREHVDRPIALRYAAGGGAGALVGGLVAVALPELVLRAAMVVLAAMAIGRQVLGWKFGVSRRAMAPLAFAVGFASATSGGGGLLAGPALMSSGLSGRAYPATGAVGAAVIHIARGAAYGAAGVMDERALLLGGLAAACIPLGNLLGERMRDRIGEKGTERVELGTVAVCAVLAVLGLAR